MKKVLVAGAGQIGSLIACLLAEHRDYKVYLVDNSPEKLQFNFDHPSFEAITLNATDEKEIEQFLKKYSVEAVVASLPYFCNIALAKQAKQHGLHYFDLTEDVTVSNTIKDLSQGSEQAYVPRCGVAPGLVNIIAQDLIKRFDSVDAARLRVGCLPENTNNPLQYALTWSTDGLINEYGNLCYSLYEGKKTTVKPLDSLEKISIDGKTYEAFNTSGGVGSLVEMYEGKINILNYKSIRYPGHRDKIHFLMRGLKLNSDRNTLKRILERAIPRTTRDVTVIYVSVVGHRGEHLYEENYVKKIYPKELFNKWWSAIQVVTSVSASAVIDTVLCNDEGYQGFVMQEQFSIADIANNRIGKILELADLPELEEDAFV